jgi:hypothetical protein
MIDDDLITPKGTCETTQKRERREEKTAFKLDHQIKVFQLLYSKKKPKSDHRNDFYK